MSGRPRPLRVVALAGGDDPRALLAVRRVIERPGVRLAGVIQERGPLPSRLLPGRWWTSRRLAARPPGTGVRRAIFPNEARSLEDLCAREGVPHVVVHSLSSPEAARRITELEADLGIVVGSPLRAGQAVVRPRLGSIEARRGMTGRGGGWTAFWALYEGEGSVAVTVWSDADHAPLLEGVVPIGPRESEHSLNVKLDELEALLLAEGVEIVAQGREVPRPRRSSPERVRGVPTKAQRAALARRLRTTPESALKRAFKAAFYRLCLDLGPVAIRNAWLRLQRRSRYTVLLYHRVNDVARDKLTTSVERFIEDMSALKKRYPVVSLSAMIEASRRGVYLGPNVVAITFDDGYADNAELAVPVLEYFGLPATFFVSAGLLDTETSFAHDAKFPHRFRNLAWSQVSDMAARGFEIGSHGWAHRNLAQCSLDEARREIVQSRDAIAHKLGVAPRSFAYPYGGREDITPQVVQEIRAAGFQVIASAYGGTNLDRVDPEHVLRVGVSEAFGPLAFRASVEGVTLQALRRSLGRRRTGIGRSGPAGGTTPAVSAHHDGRSPA